MTVLAAVLVSLASLVGVLLTLLTLPGTWAMLLVAMLAWAWRPELYHWGWIAGAGVLAAGAEVAEFLASAAGARKAGGSRSASVAAIIGALIGGLLGTVFIPVPLVGTITGAVAGAAMGAFAAERAVAGGTWRESYRVGQGAGVGRLWSVVIKTGFACGMAILLMLGAWL
ncbi:MAG: DUF456 domain-containing protein [Planctomycetota bacterium]